ncbi:MAG: membrane integrity-associated transporter subunit PqiC [Desulfomonile tiedjei]|uniref:Membrane integrity-associated transporter subunit PqiC n=1 Tax=Desulfomonile tiedjei TaxID=2358 RepID=A0A9D6Z2B0_9BACT|nr:membrane integrity-associated transporter subunit PqiC [Desulfomonile tiedjei]
MRSSQKTFCEIAIKSLLVASTVMLLCGCALRSRDMIMYHSFDYPSPARENVPSVPDTLMVYNFLLESSVEMHALEISYFKGGDKSIIRHRWQENPADMVTELVLRDLANSGLFEKAVDQLSTTRYRYALEGVIRNLQGTVQDGKAKALFEIEATLIDFDAPLGKDKNILKKTYRLETPSTDDKPESVVAALNKGISEFSSQLRNDIRQSLTRRVPKMKREATTAPIHIQLAQSVWS